MRRQAWARFAVWAGLWVVVALAGGVRADEAPGEEGVTLEALTAGERVAWVLRLHAEAQWTLTLAGAEAGADLVVGLRQVDGAWQPVSAGRTADGPARWLGKVVKHDARKRVLVLSLGRGAADAKQRAELTVTFGEPGLYAGAPAGSFSGKVLGEAVTGEVGGSGKFAGPLFSADRVERVAPMDLRLVQVDGAWESGVSVSAGINQAGHSAQVVKAEGDRLELAANIGSDAYVPGDAKAVFRLELEQEADADAATGRFTGMYRGKPVAGRLSGGLQRSGWRFAELVDGRPRFEADLGQTRGGWNRAVWVPYAFPKPVDLSGFGGVWVTVSTDEPREDAWVDVAVSEADGSWYYVRDAVPLNRKVNRAFVAFGEMHRAEWLFDADANRAGSDGNFDENLRLDTDAIGRLAVGVVNPHGVGMVRFVIDQVRFAGKPAVAGPATVAVDGALLAINGQERIPGGMFGFHVAGEVDPEAIAPLRMGSLRYHKAMSPGSSFAYPPLTGAGIEFTVNSQYDRGPNQIIPSLVSVDWRDAMVRAGEGMAALAKEHGPEAVRFQWWNEAYLDFGKVLERGGRWVPADKLLAVERRAGRLGPEEVPTDGQAVRLPPKRDKDGAVLIEGRTFESLVYRVKKDAQTGRPLMRLEDPSRFSYWSGRQVAIDYAACFKVAAETAKKLVPEIQLIPGWGFRWQEDDWASWEMLYKPMIDACPQFIDGIDEHHYQGHTEGMAGGYEALQAYTDIRHGFRPKIYNTETNDLWDAPARGNALGAAQSGIYTGRLRMLYNLRDILYLLMVCPDKAEARATHAIWSPRTDSRVKVGQPAAAEGGGIVTVTGPAKLTMRHGDHAAEDGQVLVVVDLKVRAKNPRKGARFKPGPLVIGEVAHEPLLAKTMVVKGEDEPAVQVVYAVPAADRDQAMVFWPDTRRRGASVHVLGRFEPLVIAPHEKAGIHKGEWDAYWFMRNLRGRLLRATSSDESIWTVASLDEAHGRMVVVVFNNGPVQRSVTSTLAPPSGMRVTGGRLGFLEWTDGSGQTDGTREERLEGVAKDGLKHTVVLGPSRAVAYTLDLAGGAPKGPDQVRTQVFAGDRARENAGILFDLKAGQRAELPIALPEDAAGAQRAWLRVVLERCDGDDGVIVCGGQRYPLPAALTPFNASFVRDIPIDPATLKGVTSLVVEATGAEDGGNGLLLCAASVIVEHAAR